MTLATAIRKNPAGTRRFVTTSVVSEASLPYDLATADSPEKIHEFWIRFVASQPDHEADKENLVVVMLNTRFKPFAWNRISTGTLNETTAHPREILRPVIAAAAFSFILMHNHPSGDPSPSRPDQAITRRISEAADLLQVRFADHLIIGRAGPARTPYFSFREAGLL